MAAGGPRNVRHVDPATREVAEDLARRAGLSLDEWVSRLMAEGPEDATSQDYFSQPQNAYAERPRPAAEARYEAVGHPADEVGRVTQAIERLSERIQDAESRQALAIAGIERSVREMIGRLDAAEREQMQVAARFEGDLQEVKDEAAGLVERLRRAEEATAGPRSAEALHALEGAIGKVAGHVYEDGRRAREEMGELRERVERLVEAGEAADSAIETLTANCAALDGRLGVAERDAGAGFEGARDELARQLAAAANVRFDRVEQALAQMTDHVRAAEQRSASAVERMGREVLEVAQTLGRRVQTVERQSAEAADRVGAEVSRIAGAVEDRLLHADAMQAQALEKLGAEITRITERLADRIATAERRSAQAIDDVGEQVARVTERIGQRNDRAAGELADRIRQSEERTARLLEEARQRIDERLAESQRRVPEPSPALPRYGERRYEDDEDDALFDDEPFPGFAATANPFSRTAGVETARPEPEPNEADAFDDGDFEVAAQFAPAAPARPIEDRPPAGPAATVGSEASGFEAVELEPNVGFDVDDELVGGSAAAPPTAASPEPPLELAARTSPP
ncbi:MAG: Localization factor PodJS, partial [Caulobacteraceae bacterium]